MIVARQPDGRTLLDREALAALLGRSVETIARHCTPEPCGRYDPRLAEEQLMTNPDVVPITAREAATYFGVPAGTVRSWASRGHVQAVGHRGHQALYDAVQLSALAGTLPGVLRNSQAAPANLHTRCTAQEADGQFCDGASLDGAPFPICLTHAGRLLRYLAAAISDRVGDEAIDSTLDLFHRFGVIAHAPGDNERPCRPRPRQHVVYYLEIGRHIKIGTTGDLKGRLRSYPPIAVLLGTEPGGIEVEERRLAQFVHLRDAGNEWFRDDPELRAHIAQNTTLQGPRRPTMATA